LGAVKYNEAFPHAVKIYNPWHANWYNGAIKNQDSANGIYYVTLDEYHRDFFNTDIAQARKNAVVSPMALDTNTQSVAALEFDMGSNDPFSVQLEWPIVRFYDPNSRGVCQVQPKFFVAVAKSQRPTSYKEMKKAAYLSMGVSNARVDLEGGSGKYVIYVDVKFPRARSWLKEFVINVYGAPTKLQPSRQYTDPADLYQAMGVQQNLMEEASDVAADTDDDMAMEGRCGYYIDRLSKLNNGQEIASSGRDPLFPESIQSIGRPGGKCGDGSRGIHSTCGKYNNWKSMTVLKDGVQCPPPPHWSPYAACNCRRQGGKKSRLNHRGKVYYQCYKPKPCAPEGSVSRNAECYCRPEDGKKTPVNHKGAVWYQCRKPRPCPIWRTMTSNAGCYCNKGYVKKKVDHHGKDYFTCKEGQPPATQSPATKPPVTQPPATQPPATQPPATQPPATQPPATQPPATQPPTPAPTPLTYFRLKNKKDWSKNCLDLDVHSKNIIVWECHDGDNQKWAWDGGRLRSKGNSNLCVTMGGRNGESVKASECGGSADQAIKRGKDETMKTSTECTVDGEVKRCCLDWDNDDPHEVLAWGCHGRVNQKWVQAK